MLFPARNISTSSHRVVVTGAGVITALGVGWKDNASGFRSGRRAFRPVSLFDVSRHRVKEAAEITLPSALPKTRLSSHHEKRLERAGRMLLIAANEAWQQAGWSASEELPAVFGTTSGGMSLGEDFFRHATQAPRTHRGQATRVSNYQSQRQVLDLCEAFGFSGPITIIANACASGANAIGHAADLIRRGRAERVLTGGYDAISQLVFSGFDSLQALSPTRCRPFDQHRDGLALGEGAAVLTLESYDHAKKRGARILAEVAGYGAATDSHHLTQPHPQGDAALASMNAACCNARVNAEQIDYINAHGTGTPLNDVAEASAINRWAGANVKNVAVSSTKSSVGHLLGAAGAVETLLCIIALHEQWLPPTSTMETPDPICNFPIVQKPTDAKLEHVLTNSFGFGGANASLVLRRWS